MSAKTCITNAKIFTDGALQDLEILFDETGILELAPEVEKEEGTEIIDARGLALLPGLVDTHVHLREPGYTDKETIKTGSRAAAAGGFTTIFCMPNVNPTPSSVETMQSLQDKIKTDACVRVFPFGTITDNEAGMVPTDYAALKEHNGTRWFSDDGVGVDSGDVMKKAMENAVQAGVMFSCHTEDMNYRRPGASVHEGPVAQANGWTGIPSACESAQLVRDLKLAKETGVKYHADHLSAKESVRAVKEAKAAGTDCSAEVTAHHLLLEDIDVKGTNWKMNPPLRTHEDRMALIEGLENGTLDFIANDHAPHTKEQKERGMDKAPFGIVALETSFPLLYTEFVQKQKRWSLKQLLEWMSEKPAERFGLERTGRIQKGYRADFFLADLDADETIDSTRFYSKGKNTPFDGWRSCVSIEKTWCDGKAVHEKN